MIIPLRQFNKGLWLGSSVDEMPAGTLRRARGIHPLSSMSLRSRNGSAELYTLANVHTVYYFADSWFVGASTSFYHAGAQNYTTFTETDVAADRVTVSASTIAVTEVDTDEDVSVHKDFTAAYFSANFEMKLRTRCSLSVGGKCGVWALTNDVDRLYGLANGDLDHLALYWDEGGADSDTSLLIHCDGADGSTTFTDESATGHTVTAGGDAQVDTAQKKFGTGSAVLDGTGDYLSVADHADWYMGSGTFTIDFWLRFRSGYSGDQAFFSQYQDAYNYVAFWYDTSIPPNYCTFVFEIVSGGSTKVRMTWDAKLAAEVWFHCAIIRGWNGNPNDWAMVVHDGEARATVTDSDSWPPLSAPLHIGRFNSVYFDGWADEIRVSKGVARWTEEFTPPTAPYGHIQLTLHETNGSTDTTDSTTPGLLNWDTNYYLTIARDEGVGSYGELTCTIYSDERRTVVVDTLTVTLTEKQDFRYLFGMISYDGTSGGGVWSGLVADLFIETPTQDLSSTKSGLSGDRLSLARMPPTAGKTDYLFCAGGGALFKASSLGTVSNWGIDAPSSAPSAAEGAAGAMEAGTYKYKVTYKNTTTGHRSDPCSSEGSVTIGASKRVDLTSIPTSSDSQVDDRELWRTMAGGTVFFYLDNLGDNSTTTYEDNIPDASLSSIELPIDNLEPYSWFDDCLGPHNASMFWITRSQSGERGRAYYSPIGRPESVQGFIEVTSDDDPLQKLVRWGTGIGVFSKSGFHQITGTNPYEAVEVTGVPGTEKPETVKETPHGVFYEAADGVRQLVGTQSTLVAPDAVGRLFRGESPGGNLTAFEGVIAEYARNEYIISDLLQTIAYDLINKTWRDLGIGCRALHYAESQDILAVATSSKVLDLEKEGEVTDDGSAIPFDVEPTRVRLDPEAVGLARWVHIDANTNGESLTVMLLLDNNEYTLGAISPSSRSVTSFNVMRVGRVQGIRLSGNINNSVEIFGIDIDVAVPGEG